MTFSNINVSSPNDGLGDKLRNAFIIVNDNFASIGDIVDVDYITATLSNYTTIDYVNNELTDIDGELISIIGRLNVDEGNITTLQSDLDQLELSVDGKVSVTQLNNVVSTINNTISNQQLDIDTKIGDAPANGSIYGRKDNQWEVLTNGSTPTYKVYSAIVNQTVFEVPVFTILENTIGDIVWQYNDVGDYSGILANAFTINKTPRLKYLGGELGNVNVISVGRTNSDEISLIQYSMGGTMTNEIIDTYIEIRVYN